MAKIYSDTLHVDGKVSLSAIYGPWNSIQAAKDYITGESGLWTTLVKGMTIGVIENGKVVEYWNNNDVNTFEKKTSDAEFAEQAEKDAQGNVIHTTYGTKIEVNKAVADAEQAKTDAAGAKTDAASAAASASSASASAQQASGYMATINQSLDNFIEQGGGATDAQVIKNTADINDLNAIVGNGAKIGFLLGINSVCDLSIVDGKIMFTPASSFDVVVDTSYMRYSYSGDPVEIKNIGSRESAIVFNITSKTFSNIQANAHFALSKGDVILGIVDVSLVKTKKRRAVYCNFDYTFNGEYADVVNEENLSDILLSKINFGTDNRTIIKEGNTIYVGDKSLDVGKLSFTKPSRNIAAFETFKPYTNFNNNTGVFDVREVNTNTVANEEFIEIKPYTRYVLSMKNDYVELTKYAVGYYDSDYNFISTLTNASLSGPFVINDKNARYIRIKFNISGKTIELSKSYNIQLEEGSIPTEYVRPYVIGKDSLEDFKIDDENSNLIILGNEAHGNNVDLFPLFNELLNDKYYPEEREEFTALKNKVVARKNSNTIQIALISDTHEGGFYAINKNWSIRSIEIFNRISDYVDICMHGGDISCDYGTSLRRYFAYAQNVLEMFAINKPFLITKGNHDEKDNQYKEVDPLSVDWDNKDYYQSADHNSDFQKITRQTYQGGELYERKIDLMPDHMFRLLQSKNVPTSAVWGSGAYYYYDYENIRFIVANSFPVNSDGIVNNDDEYIWFMTEALDLSSKDNPRDWTVVCLRHTESTSLKDMNDIVKAFMNGTSASYKDTVIDYGDVNGGGIKFVHLHGHEHGSAGYSNMQGYLDLGFGSSSVKMSRFGQISNYNIYVLTIDKSTNKIYEDRSDGNTIVYDYNDNIVELKIGQKLQMARSGLSGQSAATWAIDNNCISIDNGIITAKSVGSATVVGTEGSKMVTYTVKVVS